VAEKAAQKHAFGNIFETGNDSRRWQNKSSMHREKQPHIHHSQLMPQTDNLGPGRLHQKQDLETTCLEEAGRWFMQAGSTPFLLPPLVTIFGEVGPTAAAFQEVLDGTLKFWKSATHV